MQQLVFCSCITLPSQFHMAVMYLVAVENSYFYFVLLVPMPVSLYCNYVLWSRWGSSSNR